MDARMFLRNACLNNHFGDNARTHHFEGIEVALQTLTEGSNVERTVEQGDAAMAQFQQMFRSRSRAGDVIGAHLVQLITGQCTLDKHDWDPQARTACEGIYFLVSHIEDEPIYAEPQQQVNGLSLSLRITIGTTYQDEVPMGGSYLLGSFRDQAKFGIGRVSNNKANCPRRTGAQTASDMVRLIVKKSQRRLHTPTRFLADVRMLRQDARDGRCRNARTPRDVSYGRMGVPRMGDRCRAEGLLTAHVPYFAEWAETSQEVRDPFGVCTVEFVGCHC
jgi:hypothetical protein